MAKPKRTFTADVGQASVGVAGPDQIEYDLDNVFAMFDPAAKLRDGVSQGGLGFENFKPNEVVRNIGPAQVALGMVNGQLVCEVA